MQGHTMNLHLRASQGSNAASTCSLILDHPAPPLENISLKKRLVLQILSLGAGEALETGRQSKLQWWNQL